MVSTSRFSLRAMTLAVVAASAGFSLNASASMGNIGTTYGVSHLLQSVLFNQ